MALSLYQWLELLEVRAGRTPSCSINETFNCAAVWNSAFAHNVHAILGVPVAGLGILWGAVALALSLLFLQRSRAGGDSSPFSSGLKVWALLGLLSCVTFVTASVHAKAVCLTCLGTYALVLVFAVAALGLLGAPFLPSLKELTPGAGWALVLAVPVYVALLYPAARTPQVAQAMLPKLERPEVKEMSALIASLPQSEKLTTSWARAQWQSSQPQDVSMFPVHARKGNPAAAVKLVEFTDILCTHCAQFEELLHEVEQAAPGSLSVEPRYYPLDAECNPEPGLKQWGDGLRCFGARLQICAEPHPSFFALRRELFKNQHRLDQPIMLAIAQRHGLESEALKSCMKSPQTEARLAEDIAYAKKYAIEGTPLVLLNGKVAPPAPVFLMGMALSGGDANASFFQQLPPPPAQ